MHSFLKTTPAKLLAGYLALALFILSAAAGTAEAMFVPSVAAHQEPPLTEFSPSRAADLAKIQSALELKLVQQVLLDNGLSPEETMVRLNKLSDDQLHQLAANTDSIQAGGDAVGFLAGVVVLALLIVLLIYLVQGRIQIK